jgi:hypothetical protein
MLVNGYLGYDVVLIGNLLPVFWRSLLPPSCPRTWVRQQAALKCGQQTAERHRSYGAELRPPSGTQKDLKSHKSMVLIVLKEICLDQDRMSSIICIKISLAHVTIFIFLSQFFIALTKYNTLKHCTCFIYIVYFILGSHCDVPALLLLCAANCDPEIKITAP